MNADDIRALVARREGPDLDFKRDQYNWAVDGNLELAKDIMAIANGLARGSAAGHILIGVDEQPDGTGGIVGIPISAQLDDAAMHEKIKVLLNRVPSFEYAVVDVDGCSVGAFQIRAGGRPFFALRDTGRVHRLRRFESLLRIGSATDLASPDQIQSWAVEDDASLRDLRRVEIEEREARLVVRPFVELADVTFSEDVETCESELFVELLVYNRGESRFTLESVSQVWTLTPRFYLDFPKLLVAASNPHSTSTPDPGGSGVAPGASRHLVVPIECTELLAYLSREFDLYCASTVWPLWIGGEVRVEAVGVTGRRGSYSVAISAEAIEAAFEAGRETANEVRRSRRKRDGDARGTGNGPIPYVAAVPASEDAGRAAEELARRLPTRRRP